MTDFPPEVQHTVLQIWRAYEKRGKQGGDNLGVPMSQVGNECSRAIWYQLHWANDREVIDGLKQRRFDTGNIEETRLLNDLEAAGFQVTRIDPSSGKQFQAVLACGWLRGKLDGIVLGLPEAPLKEHVVECKSHNEKSFKELVKKGVAEAKPDHHLQCQLYMRATGLQRCLYLAVNKNNDQLYSERIKYNADLVDKVEARIAFIVASASPPPKLHADPSKRSAFACQWCNARPECHEGRFARRNCRTCLSSDLLDGPVVRCRFWDKELDYKEQQAGCPEHRYIPALVPGKQVDSDEEKRTITYKLSNGTEWVDVGTK